MSFPYWPLMTSFSSGAGGETHHGHQLRLPLEFTRRSPPTRKRKRSDDSSAPSHGCGGFTISESPSSRLEPPHENPVLRKRPQLPGGWPEALGVSPEQVPWAWPCHSPPAQKRSESSSPAGEGLPPWVLSTGGFVVPVPPRPRALLAGGWVPGCPRSECREPQGKLQEQRASLG